jgi:hypothetical protein
MTKIGQKSRITNLAAATIAPVLKLGRLKFITFTVTNEKYGYFKPLTNYNYTHRCTLPRCVVLIRK